jgi:hypothetical protein
LIERRETFFQAEVRIGGGPVLSPSIPLNSQFRPVFLPILPELNVSGETRNFLLQTKVTLFISVALRFPKNLFSCLNWKEQQSNFLAIRW